MIQSVDPHPRRVPYPILRPRPGQPHRFVSRSRTLFGVDSHFGNRATFHCVGEEFCERCKVGDAPRYQGYLLGQSIDERHMCICHVTAAAALELKPHLATRRGLLGARIVLTRMSPAANGPVGATLFGWDDEVTEIPMAELGAIVNAIYRIKIEKSTDPTFD